MTKVNKFSIIWEDRMVNCKDFMKTIKTITIKGEKIQYDKIVITNYVYLYDHNVEVARIFYNNTLNDIVWIMELLRDDRVDELIWEK